jgi:hypothetical protein
MPTSLTRQGYANVDPHSGSVTVDLRPYGGGGIFTIDAPNGPSDIATFPAPPAPAAAIVTVASAPGGARFVKVTFTNGATRESVLSPATSAGTASAGQGAQVTLPTAYDASGVWPQAATAAPRGADGVNVYFATTLNGTYTKQNTTPLALGGTYTETSAGILSNGAAPTADTSGWSNGTVTVTVTQP